MEWIANGFQLWIGKFLAELAIALVVAVLFAIALYPRD